MKYKAQINPIMRVIKRNGDMEKIDHEKIYKRITWLIKHPYPLTDINVFELTSNVIDGLKDCIKTSEIDDYTARLSADLGIRNNSYLILAGRICIDNHHKKTLNTFSDKINALYLRKNNRGESSSPISYEFNKFVIKNKNRIDKYIDYERDFKFNYFGFKTLGEGYLLTINGEIVERPQDLIMRVAIQVHMPDDIEEFNNPKYLDKIFHTYDRFSNKYYTHATPTLFNSGSDKPSMSSCYLMGSGDSKEEILETIYNAGIISANMGGLGLHFSMIRGRDSIIGRSDLPSKGITPFNRILNVTMRAFDQGGKRKGSLVEYLEPHHPDILEFLRYTLKSNSDENTRCHDLFLGLWISDIFMERVRDDGMWHLFCPSKYPGLRESFGIEYKELYLKYEASINWSLPVNKRYEIKALDLWDAIKLSHVQSGLPYMLYKDNVNRNNMMSNIDNIHSSNLCVSGDTMILTNKGQFPIKELVDSGPIHKVWNGDIFTDATFAKTGENQELLEVETTHGYKLKCTPYHKFILVDVSNENKEKIVEAKDLIIGDEIIEYKVPDGFCSFVVQQCKITSIIKLEQREDTYCFNEPLKNRGVFNDLLTGNCCEIILPSDTQSYGVCNITSICLPEFVYDTYSTEEFDLDEEERRPLNHEFPTYPKVDYKLLATIAGELTENLNNVIDKTHNPVIQAARGNFRHRPIGIGIQGLMDVFLKFGVTFDSDKARDLNKKISEAIYYGAVSKSTEMCRTIYQDVIKNFDDKNGYTRTIYTKKVLKQFPDLEKENVIAHYTKKSDVPKTVGTYSTYLTGGGSPISKGKFHWELFGLEKKDLSGLFDWDTVRDHIMIYGIRNSVLTAYMPTGTTSHIMGNSACIEPYVNNSYKKKTLAGTFLVTNKYLVKFLTDNNMYNPEMI
ncbi:MAG: ribonucleotide reductase N-terminal alpha domain-containing protein, partial [Cetobacterium sp.]